MTQFTAEDAYVLLVDRYTEVVAERAELLIERDHLQEQLDALEKLDALEDQDDEEPEDYVSSKDLDELSKRYVEMEGAYDRVHKEYEDLRQNFSRALAKIAALQKDIGQLTIENADLEAGIEDLRKAPPQSVEAGFFQYHYNRALDEIGYLEATIADLRKDAQSKPVKYPPCSPDGIKFY